MIVMRTDIEKALDELVSQEEGMRFQGLAVVLGKKLWPETQIPPAPQRDAQRGLGRPVSRASLSPQFLQLPQRVF